MEPGALPRQPHPIIVILVTLLASFLGLQIIGPVIGFFIAIPFYPGDMMSFAEALQNPIGNPNTKIPLFIMQGAGALLGFIVIPALLLKRFGRSMTELFEGPLSLQPVVLAVAVVLFFLPVNSVFIEFNKNIQLPDFLHGVEKWAREMEDQLEGLTTFITQFDSAAQVILAFIVIAVLAGIGEEIVFRGIIQKEFHRLSNNIHLSIWITAVIFSAIHFQFYGFLPRLFLGALFGYLYFWSGSLMIVIIAHFLNNGLIVLVILLSQKGLSNIDLENTTAPWPTVLVCTVITFILLYLFKTFYDKRPAAPSGNMS